MQDDKIRSILPQIVGKQDGYWQDLGCSMGLFLPLLFLSYRGWSNGFLFFLSLLTIIYFTQHPKQLRLSLDGWPTKLIFFTLIFPIFSILISQALQQNFVSKAYDMPLRFFLAGFIFLYFKEKKINALLVLQYVLPLSMILAVIAVLFSGDAIHFWNNRICTYFVDPITFGVYTLIIGFISLLTLTASDKKYTMLIKMAGFLVGVILSGLSLSRSAWIALPVLILISIYRFRKKYWGLLIAFLAVAIVIGLATIIDARVEKMFFSIFSEAINWWHKKPGSDLTDGGSRLTMWILAFHLYLIKPITGFSDMGYHAYLLHDPRITPLAPQLIREVMFNGPHNELLANALRAGIFGLISTLLLFVGPLIALRKKHLVSETQKTLGYLIVTLSIGLFIAGFGIEVFSLKFCASFYGFMIAALFGQLLSKE